MYKIASEEVRKAVSEEGPLSFAIKGGWEDHGVDQNYIPYHIIMKNNGRRHIFDCYVSKSKLSFFFEHVKLSEELKNDKALAEVYFEKFLVNAIEYAKSFEKSAVVITSELPFAAEVLLENKYEIRQTQFIENNNSLTIRGVYYIKEGNK